MIPTNICTSRNPFALLTDDDDDDTDDNDIPQQAALASSPQANPPPFSRTDSALSDSGASSHFLVDGAHAVNIKVDLNPLTITLPDGRALHSTHTCNLDIPWLRGNASCRASRMPHWCLQQNSAMQATLLFLMQPNAAYLMDQPSSSRVAATRQQTYGASLYDLP